MDHLPALRRFALSLPETHEELTWGDVNFRVRKKIFCFPSADGMTVKADPDELDALLDDPRFERAAYVGRFGWVSMTFGAGTGLDEIHELILSSYCQVAPTSLGRAAVAAFGPDGE